MNDPSAGIERQGAGDPLRGQKIHRRSHHVWPDVWPAPRHSGHGRRTATPARPPDIAPSRISERLVTYFQRLPAQHRHVAEAVGNAATVISDIPPCSRAARVHRGLARVGYEQLKVDPSVHRLQSRQNDKCLLATIGFVGPRPIQPFVGLCWLVPDASASRGDSATATLHGVDQPELEDREAVDGEHACAGVCPRAHPVG